MRATIFWISMFGLMAFLPGFFQFSALAGGTSLHEKLIDTEWQWEQSRYNNDTEVIPKDRENYSIIFDTDGSFSGKADCNRIRGTYNLSGSQIVIHSLISTKRMCPTKSLDRVFVKDIESFAILFFRDDRLYVDLKNHSGTIVFASAREEREKGELNEETSESFVCQDPRPEVCTMEYNPVCGNKDNGTYKTYSNWCNACSDPDVARYYKGECK